MRSSLVAVTFAVLSGTASTLGAGSVVAQQMPSAQHSEIRMANGNCDVMYKKLIEICGQKYKNIDERKRCHDSARADYRKCMASQ